MIKICELLPPRADISLQAFHDHWRHPHGTIARNIRQVRRYVQNHRIPSDVVGPNPTRFEGIGEGWFDTIEDCLALADVPYMVSTILVDEKRFLDRDGVKILFLAEEVISSGAHAGAHLRTKTDISDYDLQWSDNDRALSIKLFQVIEDQGDAPWQNADDAELGHRIGAFRHVRSTPVVTPAPYVGLRELWWPTLTAFERGVRNAPDAWTTLQARPAKAFCLLTQAERQI